MTTQVDMVNHPPHYKHASGVEAIDIAELLSSNLGQALDYVWRAKKKGREEEDLKKALWYIRREKRLVSLIGGRFSSETPTIVLNGQKVLDVEGKETLLGEFIAELIYPRFEPDASEYDDAEYATLLADLERVLVKVVEPNGEEGQ